MKTMDFDLAVKEMTDQGVFEGYGSVFGNTDSYGERVMPGAFADSLAKHRREGTTVPMLWQHDPCQPIGVWDNLAEDGKGLRGTGRLMLGVPEADKAYKLLKGGVIRGLSIGYREVSVEPQDNVRLLKALDLHEISVVTFPANRLARAESVKSQRMEEFARRLREGDPLPAKEFEDILREAGVPKSMATRIASVGYVKAIRSESEGEKANEQAEFWRGLLPAG